MIKKLLIFFIFFASFFTLGRIVNACTCHCSYLWWASCGGLNYSGSTGCDFEDYEIDEIEETARDNPGEAYTGVCTYTGSNYYLGTCYYDFDVAKVNPLDGCNCPTGGSPFCGYVGECTACNNPVYKFTNPCPTNTPTPTLTPTPANQYPQCSNFVITPSGTPVNSYTQGDILTLKVTASDTNLNSVAFYYTTAVQVNYCAPTPSWTPMGNGTRNLNEFTLQYNTTSLPYGDYMIVAKIGDSGVPALFCTGNPGCVDQYNCCSQTNVTSCPTCRKQIEIRPPCDPSFSMSSTSNCNNTTLSLSNLPATHTSASGYDPNNVVTGTISNCVPGVTATGPINCTANDEGTFTWTHYYQDCIGGKCSNICNKVYTGNTTVVPLPDCPLTQCYMDPNPLYYGGTAQLSAYIENVDPNLVVTPIAPTVEGFSCSTRTTTYDPPLPANETKILDTWACGTPAPNPPYSFTYTYNYLSETCPGAYNVCSCSLTPTPTVPPGYLITTNGDTFIGGSIDTPDYYINQSSFPVPYSTYSQSLSTFTLSSSFNNSNTKVVLNNIFAPCDLNDNGYLCSTKRYLLMDYQDANTTNSSYSYLRNLIISRADKDAITLKETNDDTYSNSLVDGYDVVHVLAPTFYVTAYSNCVDKVVFLIEGNLVITPDLKITGANREAACMFIVQGKTTIRDDNDEDSGINDDDGDGIPDPDTDIVRAFIVTNQFETELNNQDDSLEILGGLIINSTNTGGSIFNRNVNNNASRIIYPSKPSELFVYEGARYIDNLRHILFSPLTASIVEPQYMLTVN